MEGHWKGNGRSIILYGFHGSDGYDGFIQSKNIQNYPKIVESRKPTMDFFGQQLKTIQDYYKDPFEGQQRPTIRRSRSCPLGLRTINNYHRTTIQWSKKNGHHQTLAKMRAKCKILRFNPAFTLHYPCIMAAKKNNSINQKF